MEQTLQAHIQLSADLDVKYALLPGDPARVERAKLLLEDAVDLAFNREYKSVLGTYQGMKVLVISSGIGGPSTAIAIEELARIGIEGIIRIGSCGSLHPAVHLGDVIIATAAVRDDGASKAYVDSAYPAVADLDLLMDLRAIAETERIPHRLGIVRSHDSFYTAREAQLTAYWSGNGFHRFDPDRDWDQLSRQIHRGRIASAALVGLDRNGIVRYVGGTGNRCRFRDHQ